MKGLARVAVLGLGDFGYHFAVELYRLGHEVLAVDSNQDKVQRILPDVTKSAVADVADHSVLEELGIAGFDIVAVCLPERLETTVLLVHHLQNMRTPQIMVKVANEEQAAIVRLVGATEVILPDRHAAHKAAMLIHHTRSIDFLELGQGWMVVAGSPPASLVGSMIEPLTLQERYGVSLLAVWQPGQEGPPRFPEPGRPVAKTDILILAGHIDRLRELRKIK
ncbi:MAG: TrkA family potassium uptake protein [Thermodesulfobacteriota bacterium]